MLGALILLIVLSPLISSTIAVNQSPVFYVSETDSITGGTGYSIINQTHTPERNITVYNGNVLDSDADWVLDDGHYQSVMDRKGIDSVYQKSDGIHVILEGYHKYGDNYFDSEAIFRGMPILPVMNYSEVEVAVKVRTISGSAVINLSVMFKDPSSYEFSAANETGIELDTKMQNVISLTPSLSHIREITQGLSAECVIVVTITSQVKSEVVIEEVRITAISNEDLYPITIDIQAPDGESLVSNEYTDRLGGILREGWDSPTVFHYYTYQPVVWLNHTEDENNPGLLLIRKTNETFYLKEGVYSGVAGWGKIDSSFGLDSIIAGINITITVSADNAVTILIRIQAVRLFITISPIFAYTRIEIDSTDGSEFYYIDYPISPEEYLYLPIVTNFTIKVSPLQYNSRQIDEMQRVFSLQNQFSTRITKSAESNILVTINFSDFEVLGFIFDAGFIIQVISVICIIGIILLTIYENKKWTKPKIQPSLLPLATILVSIFTPWINYRMLTSANPETLIYGNVFVPILMTLWGSTGSSITIAPSSYLHPNLILLGGLYWLPVGYLVYEIVYKRSVLSFEYLEKVDSLLVILILLGPLVLAINYLNMCLTGICTVSIGLIATIAILPMWILAKVIDEKQKATAQ